MKYLVMLGLFCTIFLVGTSHVQAAALHGAVAVQSGDDYDKAYALFEAKQYKEALAVLDSYLATHTTDARSFVLRGDVKADLGDDQGALKDYNRAIEIDPQYQYAYVTRCETRLFLDNVSGALDDCNLAIKLDPNDALAHEDRADVLFDKGDFKGALADYSKAIELGRSNPYIFAARCDTERIGGQLDAAAADCDKSLTLDPQVRRGLWANGRLALVKDDYASAVKYLTAYIAQKPNSSDNAYYFRAQALNRLQDYARALSDINTYIKLHPEDPDGYQERSIARFGSGDKVGAVSDIEEAVRGYQKAGDAEAASKASGMADSMRAGQFPKLP